MFLAFKTLLYLKILGFSLVKANAQDPMKSFNPEINQYEIAKKYGLDYQGWDGYIRVYHVDYGEPYLASKDALIFVQCGESNFKQIKREEVFDDAPGLCHLDPLEIQVDDPEHRFNEPSLVLTGLKLQPETGECASEYFEAYPIYDFCR